MSVFIDFSKNHLCKTLYIASVDFVIENLAESLSET